MERKVSEFRCFSTEADNVVLSVIKSLVVEMSLFSNEDLVENNGQNI